MIRTRVRRLSVDSPPLTTTNYGFIIPTTDLKLFRIPPGPGTWSGRPRKAAFRSSCRVREGLAWEHLQSAPAPLTRPGAWRQEVSPDASEDPRAVAWT